MRSRGNRQSVATEDLPESNADRSFSYNTLNQLSGINDFVSNMSVEYTYYPNGMRASKSVKHRANAQPDVTRYITYNGQIIEELDGNDQVKARNIYGNELIYRDNYTYDVTGRFIGTTGGYYLYNALRDVVKIIDSKGKTQNEYSYDAWGKTTAYGAFKNPFLYRGQMEDQESGFYYLRARYYDPEIGRFINEDTVDGDPLHPITLNKYTYAGNNPLRYHDPNGQFFETIVDVVGIAWTVVDLISEPSWENAGYLAWDVAAVLLPFVPGSYVAKAAKAVDKVQDAVTSNKVVVNISQTVKSLESYKEGMSDTLENIIFSCALCFTAGKKVLTDKGEKAIEHIQVGDKVLSQNEEGKQAYKPVTMLFRRTLDRTYDEANFEDAILPI